MAEPGKRVPDGAVPVRDLAPGEYTRDKAGFWYVRPPAPGYLQHLNRDAYPVMIEGDPEDADAPISVDADIVQATTAWRLKRGEWIRLLHPSAEAAPA